MNKARHLAIRVTEEERKRFELLAQNANMSLTALIRTMLLLPVKSKEI